MSGDNEIEAFVTEAIAEGVVIRFDVVRLSDDRRIQCVETEGQEPCRIARRIDGRIRDDARIQKGETHYEVRAIGDAGSEVDARVVTKNAGALAVRGADRLQEITALDAYSKQNESLLMLFGRIFGAWETAGSQREERLMKRIDALESREHESFSLREKLLKDWSERERDLATERRWDKLLSKLEPGISALMTHAFAGKDGRAPPAIENHVLAQAILHMTDDEITALLTALTALAPETQQRLEPLITPHLALRDKMKAEKLAEDAKSAAAAVAESITPSPGRLVQ